jgi:hypothetical protein
MSLPFALTVIDICQANNLRVAGTNKGHTKTRGHEQVTVGRGKGDAVHAVGMPALECGDGFVNSDVVYLYGEGERFGRRVGVWQGVTMVP